MYQLQEVPAVAELSKKRSSGSFVHFLFRVPLGIFFTLYLLAQCQLYWFIRFWICAYEAFFCVRGKTSNLKKLHEERYKVDTYKEYQRICLKIDEEEGRKRWRDVAPNRHYDSNLILSTTTVLRKFREAGNAKSLMEHLVLKENYGGIMNIRLYNKTWSGTKHVIDKYIEEVVQCINWLAHLQIEDRQLLAARVRFFQRASREFGNTAFCLSGGSMNGVYHLGVVKALLENGIALPKFLSGSSAGAVMGAMLAVHTDEEIKAKFLDDMDSLHQMLGEKGPFPGTFLEQLQTIREKGRMYAAEDFEKCVKNIIGDVTFKEAFLKTGRTFIIPCTPVKDSNVRGHPSLMMSHMTTPNVPIAYAVVASCTVPGILDPVQIMEKVEVDDICDEEVDDGCVVPKYLKKDGKSVFRPLTALHPEEAQRIFMRDGTLESDIPAKHLWQTFNIKFSLVSQTNPHVIPFFFNNRGEPGKPVKSSRLGELSGWRGGFFGSFCESYLKEDMIKNLKIVSRYHLLPDWLGVDWTTIYLQDFRGDITVTPPTTVRDYMYIMSNFTDDKEGKELLEHRIRVGEHYTWKVLPLLKNRLSVQSALDSAVATIMNDPKSPHIPPPLSP